MDRTLGYMAPRYLPPFPFLNSRSQLTSQIFPTHIRAKGINICASAGAIGSIVVAQFYPVALSNIGSQTYFIFFSINAASLIVSSPLA